jgi:AraC-like DNA-binding protein
MHTFTPTPRRGGTDTRRLFADTFRRQILALETGRAQIRIPQTRELYQRLPEMAYHFKPELFVQLAGTTDFRFPNQAFTLAPNEICVMPRGVPHAETARHDSGSFENVVVCFYNETVAIHVAHELSPGKPGVDDIHFFTTDFYGDLVEYLNRIDELRFRAPEVSATAIKGLLLAEFSLLLAVVEERTPQRFSETERVFRCQWLIRNNLDDPELGVAGLAAELRCSPGHLSKVFQEEVGEKIVEHINRLRLQSAIEALRSSQLSVKEIAAACGYQGANYFARVFRQSTGRSPHEYRQDLHRVACALEKQPKAVFHDHDEFGFALKPEVMAAATVQTAR